MDRQVASCNGSHGSVLRHSLEKALSKPSIANTQKALSILDGCDDCLERNLRDIIKLSFTVLKNPKFESLWYATLQKLQTIFPKYPATCIHYGIFNALFTSTAKVSLPNREKAKALCIASEICEHLSRHTEAHHISHTIKAFLCLIKLLMDDHEEQIYNEIVKCLNYLISLYIKEEMGKMFLANTVMPVIVDVFCSLDWKKDNDKMKFIVKNFTICLQSVTRLLPILMDSRVLRIVAALVGIFLNLLDHEGLAISLIFLSRVAAMHGKTLPRHVYTDVLPTIVDIDQSLLVELDVKLLALDIFIQLMESIEKSALLVALHSSEIISFLVMKIQSRSNRGCFSKLLSLLEALFERNNVLFKRAFMRGGGLHAIENIAGSGDWLSEEDKVSLTNIISCYLGWDDEVSKVVARDLENVCNILNDDETLCDAKNNCLVSFVNNLGNFGRDYEKGFTAFELLRFGVVECLESYLKDESRLFTFARACLEEDNGKLLANLVRKLVSILDYESHENGIEFWKMETGALKTKVLDLVRRLFTLEHSFLSMWVKHLVDEMANGSEEWKDVVKLATSQAPPKLPAGDVFANRKLTLEMMDEMSLSLLGRESGNEYEFSVPTWCKEIMRDCPIVISYEVRRLYMVSSYKLISHAMWDQCIVSREKLLETTLEKIEEHSKKDSVRNLGLLVGFDDERGRGHGPTNEFFTMISKELQKSEHGMWIEMETNKAGTLFPRPYNQEDGDVLEMNVLPKFLLLGRLMGCALRDGRFLDSPLSPLFYRLAFGPSLDDQVDIYDVFSVNQALGQYIMELEALYKIKEKMKSDGALNLQYRGYKLEDLFLPYSLPCYQEVTLRGGGDEFVTIDNLEEYVEDLYKAAFGNGIQRQLGAFRRGFEEVLPLEVLSSFLPKELENLFCGEGEAFDKPWTAESIRAYIKFEFTDFSKEEEDEFIDSMVGVLMELNSIERQQFIRFVTAFSRLPVGGLTNFCPPLMINGAKIDDDGDSLPTALTCIRTLRMPFYSKTVMKEKLVKAITEGNETFYFY